MVVFWFSNLLIFSSVTKSFDGITWKQATSVHRTAPPPIPLQIICSDGLVSCVAVLSPRRPLSRFILQWTAGLPPSTCGDRRRDTCWRWVGVREPRSTRRSGEKRRSDRLKRLESETQHWSPETDWPQAPRATQIPLNPRALIYLLRLNRRGNRDFGL